MSKYISKEEIILHKNNALNKINDLLELYINSPNTEYLKKVSLLSYWFENYSDYIKNEVNFDPKRLISYKRGDVIKANFGFNVGSELGGLHYAVVLDNDNSQSSPVITVIPLSSGTLSKTHPNDVFLGNELYRRLNEKNKFLSQGAIEKLDTCILSMNAFKSVLQNPQTDYAGFSKENLKEIMARFEVMQEDAKKDVRVLEKYRKEISRMKQGSIALMGQITTISKMRIYIPKKSTDILYGVSLSADAMEKINEKIKKLFIKSK